MARALVSLQTYLRKLEPRFDDCPAPCGETDEYADTLCAVCPVKKQWEYFEREAKEEIARRFGGSLPWSFESLYADVLRVFALKRLPRDADALTAALFRICAQERDRPQRIRLYELELKAKSGE